MQKTAIFPAVFFAYCDALIIIALLLYKTQYIYIDFVYFMFYNGNKIKNICTFYLAVI